MNGSELAAAALSPWIVAFNNIVVPAIVTAIVGYAAFLFHKWTGVQITAANLEIIDKAATRAAGMLVAAADDSLAHTTIDASHPLVLNAAARLIAIAPSADKAMKDLGLSPGSVAGDIAAKIGEWQAAQTTVTTPMVLHDDKTIAHVGTGTVVADAKPSPTPA